MRIVIKIGTGTLAHPTGHSEAILSGSYVISGKGHIR